MNFLQELGSHRGGLLLLKSELWWYGARAWDGARGRICLLMDAAPVAYAVAAATRTAAFAPAAAVAAATARTAAALLLIDGRPQWVWVDQEDVELL